MSGDDLLGLYLVGSGLFMVAFGIAVRSKLGWRNEPNMGFRRELREVPIFCFFITAWPLGILRWRWLVARWVAAQRPIAYQTEPKDPRVARRELRLAVGLCASAALTFFVTFAEARSPLALALGGLALGALPVLLKRLATLSSESSDPK